MRDVEWPDETHFNHWGHQSAEWIGTFDIESQTYTKINHENIQRSLQINHDMLTTFGHHKSFGAYEPVNEPWGNTPYEVLSDFYRQTRQQV